MKIRYALSLLAVILVSGFGCVPKNDADSNGGAGPTPAVDAGGLGDSGLVRVPLITWGADMVAVHANGGTKKTSQGSIFARHGLNLELFREDDFGKQTSAYLRGESPFLRGTMGMINIAAESARPTPEAALVVVYQHSWSAGGDALVVKSSIKTVKDLRGKTVAIQKNGPHMAYFMKLLADAGLRASDVKTLWTKDLVGPDGDTPMAKFYENGVDAAFVIIPDALALTSSGKVGTGAEDSVKGAAILLSTKTANRVISDVYAVRQDYFEKNRSAVKNFVQALLVAEEEVRDLFKNTKSEAFKRFISSSAAILLDSAEATADMEGMYYDAEMAGFQGNIRFFAEKNNLRSFERLRDEIQTSFMSFGLMTRKTEIRKAGWDFNELRAGLRYAEAVAVPKFESEEVAKIVTRQQEPAALKSGELFAFEIQFQPNQDDFSANQYRDQFDKVIGFSSTYGGAIITIEGHSDPMGYLRAQKEGKTEVMLNQIKQAAKNLSLSRANSVRDQLIAYASLQGLTLDASQFATVGHGLARPLFAVPQTEQEWLGNMRVEFKVIQIEAEENVFKRL